MATASTDFVVVCGRFTAPKTFFFKFSIFQKTKTTGPWFHCRHRPSHRALHTDAIIIAPHPQHTHSNTSSSHAPHISYHRCTKHLHSHNLSSHHLIISSRQSHIFAHALLSSYGHLICIHSAMIRAYTYRHSMHHTQKEPIQMKIRILLLHLLIIIASSAPDNRALSPIHT